ncbi:MAG: 1,4-alpha-glucan branching enzyme, partial [Nitriliruptorales bacterium]|nr:1,4-alpha-glucan branching enzyme [Nitriliruptorales bacterium]
MAPGKQNRTDQWRAAADAVAAIVSGTHREPHAILGLHPVGDGAVVRVWRPDAAEVAILRDGANPVVAERSHGAGFFEAWLDAPPKAADYRLQVTYPDGGMFELRDAYAFWPTFGDVDLHLAGEGRHEELWRRLGAHLMDSEGVSGTSFAVWAPNARSVRVIGDFNSWDGRLHPMRALGASGVWELFIPEIGSGARYKYEIVTADGRLVTRADPFASWAEVPPGNASRV